MGFRYVGAAQAGDRGGSKDAQLGGKSEQSDKGFGSPAQEAKPARGDSFTKDKLDRLGALVKNKEVGHLAFRVAFDIAATYMNRKTRNAWPGQTKLAADLGVSDRTIRSGLKELKAVGFFDVVSHRGTGKSSLFTFPDRKQASAHTASDRKQRSAQDAVLTGRTVPPDRKQASGLLLLRSSEPIEEPSECSARETHIRKSGSGRKTSIPAGWPTTDDKNWAVRFWNSEPCRSDLAERADDIAAACRDHHLSKGSVFKDWSAAWRTWARNELKFSKPNSHPHATGGMSAARGIFHALDGE